MENLTKNLVSIKKLRSLPIVNYTCGYLSKIFFNEEEHPNIAALTRKVGEVALSFADELSLETKLEKPILMLDELAASGLCILEENFPFVTKEPDQILESLKESYANVFHKTQSTTTEIKSSTSDKLEEIFYQISFSELWEKVEKEVKAVLELAEFLVEISLPPIDDEEREHNVRGNKNLILRSADLLVTVLKRIQATTDLKKVLAVLIATFDDMPSVARSLSFILWIYVTLTENYSTS